MMQKKQSDVRRPPVPIFAAKRPRTALLAHPNNTKTENEKCPPSYTGTSQTKPNTQQWNNNPNITWQNRQQGPNLSRQQNTYQPIHQQQPKQGSSTWQQWPNQGNSACQQQSNQGNSTCQQQSNQGNSTCQQQSNQGNSTWQQQSNQGNSTWQQQHNQGNSTWEQQSNQGNSTRKQSSHQGNSTWQQHPNQGNSTWQQQPINGGTPTWQRQQPYQQANQGPVTATWSKTPQMNPNSAPSLQYGGQGNQLQPKYGQSVPNMDNDWQSPQSYGNQKRQGGYQRQIPQQNTGQYNGNGANAQALKQTTIHQSFKHTITPRQPQNVPNQPMGSHQGSNSGYGFNNPKGQMYGNDSSPSPRYGETPSFGQHKTSTISHQPWGMASVPNRTPFTPSDNLSIAPTNQGIDNQQAPHVTKSRAPDKSLKLLSATVQGMQHWSRYREKTALIFELIGRVDSAVRNDQKSSFREFMLKDDKEQAVRCVFFEIDRQSPHLVRGQFYRCVGTYEPGTQRVRCVSVRAATETERRLHRAGVTASDRAMRDWASSIRET